MPKSWPVVRGMTSSLKISFKATLVEILPFTPVPAYFAYYRVSTQKQGSCGL